jgi:hypothetical protein
MSSVKSGELSFTLTHRVIMILPSPDARASLRRERRAFVATTDPLLIERALGARSRGA